MDRVIFFLCHFVGSVLFHLCAKIHSAFGFENKVFESCCCSSPILANETVEWWSKEPDGGLGLAEGSNQHLLKSNHFSVRYFPHHTPTSSSYMGYYTQAFSTPLLLSHFKPSPGSLSLDHQTTRFTPLPPPPPPPYRTASNRPSLWHAAAMRG